MLPQLQNMGKLKWLHIPPWYYSDEPLEDLKSQHPWINISQEPLFIASPYDEEDDEKAKFRFWDIHAQQIGLFSVCPPKEEQADD